MVGSLTGTPTLMVMVILNIAMIGTAGWYLTNQEDYRHIERLEFIALLKTCLFDRVEKPE